MPDPHIQQPNGKDHIEPPIVFGDKDTTLEDEEEDDLFGEPPGSDLNDPADDDW